jgi:hypothetical protein
VISARRAASESGTGIWLSLSRGTYEGPKRFES